MNHLEHRLFYYFCKTWIGWGLGTPQLTSPLNNSFGFPSEYICFQFANKCWYIKDPYSRAPLKQIVSFDVGTPTKAMAPGFIWHQARPIMIISPHGLSWSPYLIYFKILLRSKYFFSNFPFYKCLLNIESYYFIDITCLALCAQWKKMFSLRQTLGLCLILPILRILGEKLSLF